LAAKIKDRHGLDVELIEGKGGVFDIVVDGKLIYSKKETGRFPEDDEVLGQLAG
jgi:selenoprotein W-related protein